LETETGKATMFGPGKYDDICTLVRERVGITDATGGGVIVIVLGGNKGNGFACQADAMTTLALPALLEHVVHQMRAEDGVA
jgi:hypothetical protein